MLYLKVLFVTVLFISVMTMFTNAVTGYFPFGINGFVYFSFFWRFVQGIFSILGVALLITFLIQEIG